MSVTVTNNSRHARALPPPYGTIIQPGVPTVINDSLVNLYNAFRTSGYGLQTWTLVESPITPVVTQVVGLSGVQTSYLATGQKSLAVAKNASFIADITESMDYEVTLPGAVVTLKDSDPVGTVFQIHTVGTGFVASPVVLDPEGGTLINGASSYNIDRDNGSQYVRKVANGTWLASQ